MVRALIGREKLGVSNDPEEPQNQDKNNILSMLNSDETDENN